MARKNRGKKSGGAGAKPIPRQQEQALVRKISRSVARDARWHFGVNDLNLGSFGGGAAIKGVSFGSGNGPYLTPKIKAVKNKAMARAARNLESTSEMEYGCNAWAGDEGCQHPGSPHNPEYWMRNTGGTVGLAPHSMNLQVVQPRVTSTFRDGVQVDVLQGTDIIGAVELDSVKESGDVLKEVYINPSAFISTRMAQMAPLYQRYRFSSIEFLYEPVANATQSGQVIGFCTFDPDSPLEASNPLNLNRAAAFYGNRQNQIWEAASYGQHQPSTMTDLYVDPSGADTRFSYQGIFYLIAAGKLEASGSLALGTIGQIYVRYTLEMSIPQLHAGLGSIAASRYDFTPTVVSGNLNMFGTSSVYGITPVGGSNTITAEATSATQLTIVGVPSSSLIAVGISAGFSGSGGVAYSAGLNWTMVSGGTILDSHGTFTVYNGSGGELGGTCYVQVSSAANSVILSIDDVTGGSITSSSADGFVVITVFPPGVSELLAGRRREQEELTSLVALMRPLLDARRKALKEDKGKEAAPDESSKGGRQCPPKTERSDLASFIRGSADMRCL